MRVNVAVHFDGQAQALAVEVQNPFARHVLPVEIEPANLAGLQPFP
jgi:hypothetical protein